MNKFCLLTSFSWICFFSAVVFSQYNFTSSELIGSYTDGGSLTLTENGEYKDIGGACTVGFRTTGLYNFDSGILHLTAVKIIENDFIKNTEIDLLNPQENPKAAEEQRFFSYIPVKWQTRIYLIPEYQIMDFINAVNLSVEPRESTTSEIYMGNFYLRDTKQDSSEPNSSLFRVKGFPDLPEKWSSFLLKKPVTAKVIKIESDDKEKTALIDKGEIDGLKIGMRLIFNNNEPSPWSGVVVLSVDKKTAKVSVSEKLKIGDQLNSRFIHENIMPFLN